jgi:hypothetical protein
MDFSEIVVRDLQIAYEVLRVLKHSGHIGDTILRLGAEIYEAGSSPLVPFIKS